MRWTNAANGTFLLALCMLKLLPCHWLLHHLVGEEIKHKKEKGCPGQILSKCDYEAK